jgi:hypothetical protein
MRWFWLALLLVAAPASAQLHTGHSGLAHGIPDLCAADAVALIVPAGQSRVFSGVQSISCLGIHGTATLDGTARLLVTTILIYDDGSLTVQDGAQITYRNTPLNTTLDPEQYGNGLIGLGRLRVLGAPVAPFVRLTADVEAGATVLRLSVQGNWRVGHRLWIPDTHQTVASDLLPGFPDTNVAARRIDQGEVCTLAAITTTTVTCAQPLQFAHLGAHSPAMNGRPAIDLYPHVANLTRGIVFRSENPLGVRAHSLFSQRADVQIRGAAFVDMGRTLGIRLDDTTFNSDGLVAHVGRNQRARYPVHFHHVFGPVTTPDPYQFIIADSVIEHGQKWGIAIHNSSWGLVQENIVVDASGAGILTEDGNETENTFDRNFVSSVENRAGSEEFSPLFTYDVDATGGTAVRGTAFWFKAMNQRVTNNIAYASRSCYAWYTGNSEGEPTDPQATSHPQRIPRFRGADTTVDANIRMEPNFLRPMLPIDGNECASASHFGIEAWWTQAGLEGLRPDVTFHNLPITNSTFWHIGGVDSTGQSQGGAISVHYADAVVDGVTAVNEGGVGLAIVAVNDGGGMGLGNGYGTVRNADMRGFDGTFQHGGQLALPAHWRFTNSFFQNRVGIDLTNVGEQASIDHTLDANGNWSQISTVDLENVIFTAYPGAALNAIRTRYVPGTSRGFEGRRRIRINVKGHQGKAGDDFRVYFTGQAASAPAPGPNDNPSADPYSFGCPEPLTNQACFDKYKIATLMQVAPATATLRPEIVGLIGPIPSDEIQPLPAPGVPPAPPASVIECVECVSSVTLGVTVWTLGAAHPAGWRMVLRNGVDTGAAGLGFILAIDGFLYLYTAQGNWYRWEPAGSFWNGPGFLKPTPATPVPTPTTKTCRYVAPGSTTEQQLPVGTAISGINQIATQAIRWPLLLSWWWQIEAVPRASAGTPTAIDITITCQGPP